MNNSQVSLNLVSDAVVKFQAVQDKCMDYGASSTGTDEVFHNIVDKALSGEDFEIPRSQHEWKLFRIQSMYVCPEAADALHHAALCVVQAIWACQVRDMKELKEYLGCNRRHDGK